MKFLWILIVLINYKATTEAKYHNNVFKEELVIKELKDSFVNTYFQFTTKWNFKSNKNERKKTIDFFHLKFIFF